MSYKFEVTRITYFSFNVTIEQKNDYWVFKQWTYKKFFNNNDVSKENNLK